MRRAVVLVVLLAAMLGLDALKIDRDVARDPLTLAAIGFVVLAAFTVAEAGSTLKLPRVTGYIVAGVVLGPSVLDVLSTQVVREMQMFNTLALGLIAMAAGLELHVKALIKLYKTLLATVGIKLTLGAGLVAGVLVAMESAMGAVGLGSQGELYALALVMGALSIGTSPSVVLAVTKESEAKGRLSDLVLGAAVLKDLVVVVCLAVAVAVGRTFVEPGASLDASVLVHVGEELGLSILVGAAVGVALIAYVRFVRFEMLLFVAGLILVVAEMAKALHLELLLVFIAAGFVVSNLSKYEHELMDAINMVSLPVFVVFFTIAGAGIDLQTTWGLLPLALAVCVARALAYLVAARVGGALGGESPVVRKQAVLAYLPQAGVTLGLVGLAATQLTAISEAIRSVGMAIVTVNLLIGPITLRMALRAAGEIGGEEDAAASPGAAVASSGKVDWPEEASLAEPLIELERRLDDTLTILVDEAMSSAIEELGDRASQLPEALAAPRDEGATEPANFTLDTAAIEVREALAEAFDMVRSLPSAVEVSIRDEALAAAPEDTARIRLAKTARRFGRHVVPDLGKRTVPLRELGRIAYEPRLAAMASGLLASMARLQAGLIEEARRVVIGQQTPDDGQANSQQLARAWRKDALQRVVDAVAQGARASAVMARRVGTPGNPARQLRYSDVEPQTRAATDELEAVSGWDDLLAAATTELRLVIAARGVGEGASQVVSRGAAEPLGAAWAVVEPMFRSVMDRLEEVHEGIPKDRPATAAELTALDEAIAALASEEELGKLEEAYVVLRGTLNTHDMANRLRTSAATLPETVTVPKEPVVEAARADLVHLDELPARRVVAELMVDRVIPELDERTRQASSKIAAVPIALRDAIALAGEAVAGRRDLVGISDETALAEEIALAATRLKEAEESLRDDLEALRALGASVTDAILSALAEATKTTAVESRVRATQRFLRRLREAVARLVGVVTQQVRRFLPILGRIDATVDQAAEIRERVEAWSATQASAAYLRHFADKPLKERRFFAVRHDELVRVLDAEARWLGGGPGSVIVVGDQGSGKTSLLNLAQVDFVSSSVLRVAAPSASRHKLGLLDALAYELGCRPTRRAVERALRSGQTTIVIDDLHHWFEGDLAGIDSLDTFVDVVVKTQRTAFWVVGVDASVLAIWEELVALRRVFATVVTLGPLDVSAVAQVIERRHEASGRELVVPENRVLSALRALGQRSERDFLFRVLAGVSRGNLDHAITNWRRIVQQREDGVIEPDLRRLVDAGLSWNLGLGPRELAVLALLARFGPASEEVLAGQLYLSRHVLRRHLSYLAAAGLIAPSSGGRVAIPRAIAGKIIQLLIQRSVWSARGGAG